MAGTAAMVRVREGEADMRFATSESAGSFEALEPSWNRLALKTTNPFLTHEWVSSWWRSFGGEETMASTLSGDGGELVGAAALTGPAPVAGGAMNAYSAMWDVSLPTTPSASPSGAGSGRWPDRGSASRASRRPARVGVLVRRRWSRRASPWW